MRRSYLFVPATRPERVEKAIASRADVVVVDLEDAVSPADKVEARENLRRLSPSRELCVRINDATTEYHEDDLKVLSRLEWLDSVMLSKVTSSEQVRDTRVRTPSHVSLLALIESAQGIVAVDDIAASGVSRLVFGAADYASDLGAPASDLLYAYPRSRLVVASAAAGIDAPVDGATLATNDPELLRSETLTARALGMGGRLCIHPDQVMSVNALFDRSASELAWARLVVEEFEKQGGGVFQLEGKLIDAPIVALARQTLGE